MKHTPSRSIASEARRPNRANRVVQLILAALAASVFAVHAAGPVVLFKPSTSVDLAAGGVGDRIAVGDFDGDGNLDLVTTPDLFAPESFPNVDGVTLLYGNGQGLFPEVGGFLAGEYLTDIDAADFNGDGIPDLVTTEGFYGSGQTVPVGICQSTGPKVPVFLGSAIGTFTLQSPCLYAGRRPGSAAAADFDEDGLTDLVVTISTYDNNTVDRDTYFLSGNGDGSFAAGQVFLTEKSNHMSAADFNRDGHLDLAMPGRIYLGTGRGTFVSGPVLGGGEAVGDINKDGIPDLASLGKNNLYNPADDVVRVRLGQADGSVVTFGAPLPTGTNPSVESYPIAVAIADLNGDGYGDIVVVNSETDDVAIYLRDPAGTFHPRQNVSTAALTPNGTVTTSPRGLAIADWNKDGHLDIVVSNYNPSADGTPNDGTVTVLIQNAVARPAAADDTAVTPEGVAVPVDVIANDFDGTGMLDATSITVVRLPAHGGAVPAGGVITYTPAAGFAGVDDFTYTIRNTAGAVSNLATVTVIVKRNNKLPVAHNDAASTLSNSAVRIDILANDNDPDGSLLPGTVVLLSQPASGSASVDPLTGVVTYQPAAAGTYRFSYSVQDNGGATTNVATVTVTVTAVNTPPVAVADSATTPSGAPVVIYVLTNDSDPNGDILDRTKLAITTPPAHGGVTVNTSTGGITYTPVAGYSGPDSFVYTVKDIHGATSNPATVSITVTAGSNQPPTAANGALATNEDVAAGGTLAATDPENSPLTFSIVSNGSKGTATITNAATGVYTYTPAANASGTDSFSFRASDGSLNSNTATVTVTISAVNEDTAPVITVAATDATATEAGPTTGSFAFTRTGSTAAALTVNYVVGGTATAGRDYATLGTSVTFPIGARTVTRTVMPIDDTLQELKETVILSLTQSPNYAVGSASRATVTLTSNETVTRVITVAASDATATEAGPTTGRFTFTRTGSTAAALTVNYGVGGTATAGSDYVSLGSSITFPIGARTVTRFVKPINDTLQELNETVILTLSQSPNYAVGSARRATVTVTSND